MSMDISFDISPLMHKLNWWGKENWKMDLHKLLDAEKNL
jgi:hypothetical protein